jgi:hypothetical protein
MWQLLRHILPHMDKLKTTVLLMVCCTLLGGCIHGRGGDSHYGNGGDGVHTSERTYHHPVYPVYYGY